VKIIRYLDPKQQLKHGSLQPVEKEPGA